MTYSWRNQLTLSLSIALSAFGIYEAGSLTWLKFSGLLPTCINAPGFDCAAVLTSPWANLFGQPLSMYGFLFYLTIFFVSVFLLVSSQGKYHLLLKALTLFGFIFSLYLMGIMIFAIKALCSHCLSSAVTCLLLFLSNWLIWPKKKAEHDSN